MNSEYRESPRKRKRISRELNNISLNKEEEGVVQKLDFQQTISFKKLAELESSSFESVADASQTNSSSVFSMDDSLLSSDQNLEGTQHIFISSKNRLENPDFRKEKLESNKYISVENLRNLLEEKGLTTGIELDAITYMGGVLTSLISKVLYQARSQCLYRIEPQHIRQAILDNRELNRLVQDVMIANGVSDPVQYQEVLQSYINQLIKDED